MNTFFAFLFSLILFGNETVTVIPSVEPDSADPGDVVTLSLTIDIPDGFHVYGSESEAGIPISITLSDSTFFTPAGPLEEPEPTMHYDEIMEVDVPWLNGEIELNLPVRIESAASGQRTIEGTFGFQLCDATSCRIPDETAFSAPIRVTGEPGSEGTSGIAPPVVPPPVLELPVSQDRGNIETNAEESTGGDSVRVLAKFVGYEPDENAFLSFLKLEGSHEVETATSAVGLWAFIGGAIVAGILSIFTPCVFPMIPITVSFFSRMAGGGKRQAVGLAATYSGGIIFAYTAIGLLISVALGASGVQDVASSPWLNLVLAAVLFFFTFNLLGMFEIRVSSSGMGGGSREGMWGKMIQVLLMALAFTMASFTCTAGFVGALLVAASQGDVFWPLLGMLVYSTAFALPFFFLALFPSWLASLPQSGGWMNRIKVTMGILIFVAAFKFLTNVDMVWGFHIINRDLVLTIWVVSFFLLGFYLLGKIRLPHDDTEQSSVSVPRFILAIFVFVLAIHLTTGLGGKEIWSPINGLLPPEWYGKDVAEEMWSEDYDDALAEARRVDKLVFVDFSGYTCVNCKLMEHNIFTLPKVRSELDTFVRIRLMTDGGPDKKRNQQLARELGGTTALPLYVILDPN